MFLLFLALSFNEPKFCPTAIWNSNGITIANQLLVGLGPISIFVSTNNTIYVANRENSTIVMWEEDSVNPAKVIRGNFTQPLSLFVTLNRDIYIGDEGDDVHIDDKNYDGFKNGRVQKWMAETNNFVTVMNVNSSCWGLFVDINDTLYCSMPFRAQVVKRSFNDDVMASNRVAAGTGIRGSALDQLNGPMGIFVDINLDLYVADCENHQVQLFQLGNSNGITVAGRKSLKPTVTLSSPIGVILDAEKYLFIVELGYDRIVGSNVNGFRCLVGCYRSGSQSNQLSNPVRFSFDRSGNMFVTDMRNSRIQKFQYFADSCGKFIMIE
ncbi:unnamed protein product [Adineta steineri]|uniref:NHL repeat containing protein-like protein n=1 Tax=Adineta steineri TaxID=433720 RepID=A0A819I382_9BILA|nr:unnamed protein product [Adineta steineri]CAF3864427.1 unnamed protein product [Adineta steineri]CAF3906706.1 unnamed protein product [Adineta steineri]